MRLIFNACESKLQLLLTKDNNIVCAQEWIVPNSSTEILTPAITQMLTCLNLKPNNIKSIACVNGPGSFTGIRLTLATAAAMRRVLNIPLAGINYLQALALTGQIYLSKRQLIGNDANCDVNAAVYAINPIINAVVNSNAHTTSPIVNSTTNTASPIINSTVNSDIYKADPTLSTIINSIANVENFSANSTKIEYPHRANVHNSNDCPSLCWVLTHAKRNYVHSQLYEFNSDINVVPKPLNTIKIASIEHICEKILIHSQIATIYCLGSGLTRNSALIRQNCPQISYLNLDYVCNIALSNLAQVGNYQHNDLEPIYTRQCDAIDNLTSMAIKQGYDPEKRHAELEELLQRPVGPTKI